ncbi:MAG: Panacea domain-containing protein [Alphaproteobacteria bacterium]
MSNAENKQYTPAAIANNILWLAQQDGIRISPMKLLKLVYFVYGWSLVILKRKIFEEKIQAWQYGPVIPSLYYEFQRFGKSYIEGFASQALLNPETGDIHKVVHPMIEQEDTDLFSVISEIWKLYKDKSAMTLSDITHEHDSAWCKAIKIGLRADLDDDDIKQRSLEGINKHYASQ